MYMCDLFKLKTYRHVMSICAKPRARIVGECGVFIVWTRVKKYKKRFKASLM